jgi:hypothetical protein
MERKEKMGRERDNYTKGVLVMLFAHIPHSVANYVSTSKLVFSCVQIEDDEWGRRWRRRRRREGEGKCGGKKWDNFARGVLAILLGNTFVHLDDYMHIVLMYLM